VPFGEIDQGRQPVRLSSKAAIEVTKPSSGGFFFLMGCHELPGLRVCNTKPGWSWQAEEVL
jgi:hypothetical protein